MKVSLPTPGEFKHYPSRSFALATSPLRPLPSLLSIGGIRCGSTSLHRYLLANGVLGPTTKKELHFFDRNYHRGSSWYRSWYPIGQGFAIDSTPSYLCIPGMAALANQTVPSAKIVAVLRNPAVRAASHFAWRRGKLQEQASSLLEAIEDEPNRMTDAVSLLGCYGLHSRYEHGLADWTASFGHDNVLALVAERLFAGDPREIARLEEFLEFRLSGEFPKVNVGPGAPSDPAVSKLFAPTVNFIETQLGIETGWS